ncbi:hypothetical protein ERO13_A10G240150v2 [Gossypium hirsutum]|uniref:Uncharacterized protein n=1 Tax=Gossypium darwinii TaxID=34276 RepID=A0A5D2F3H7_GOSDA|nr:hypothetical protein ERO13_A10G240150v2 [Gossypium hirsutum]TYH00655.1 hypothetical protein ES288_A10G296300v1 [Gossypium darwinii]
MDNFREVTDHNRTTLYARNTDAGLIFEEILLMLKIPNLTERNRKTTNEKRCRELEMRGIDPRTSRMLSERSTI